MSGYNVIYSLQCRRFLRVRECFCSRSAMLKLPKRGGNGASQRERGRERGGLKRGALKGP